MKKYIILSVPLFLLSNGCEEDVVQINGYNCSPYGNCVESDNGFYLNLEDCEYECHPGQPM